MKQTYINITFTDDRKKYFFKSYQYEYSSIPTKHPFSMINKRVLTFTSTIMCDFNIHFLPAFRPFEETRVIVRLAVCPTHGLASPGAGQGTISRPHGWNGQRRGVVSPPVLAQVLFCLFCLFASR